MQLTAFDLYLLNTVGNLHDIAATISFMGTIALCFALVALTIFSNSPDIHEFEERSGKAIKTFLKYGSIVVVSCVLIFTATPTKKEIAVIYIVPVIAQSDAVQKLPSELTSLALEWIKEQKKRYQ